MNILPKKRWHVRTKDNIARVRRDEAQAAEEEKERERKIKLAEKEARRDLMRAQARVKYGTEEINKRDIEDEEKISQASSVATTGHINFFAEEEAGLVSGTAVNKDHEEEKKQEKEKYEKQIGYLTYLGQDTNEATGNVSWYNKCPEREDASISPNEETGLKHKIMADPLNSFKKFCASSFSKKVTPATPSVKSSTSQPDLKRQKETPCSPERKRKNCSSKDKQKKSCSPERTKEKRKDKKRAKHKKEKKRKSSVAFKSKPSDSDSDSPATHTDVSSEDEDIAEKKLRLEKLRAERLRREREEKKKADKLMAKIHGVAYIDEDEKPQPKPAMKQRYNSQFNPNLAKQNYEDQRYRF